MLTDGQTEGKADAYVAPCYKQVRQKLLIALILLIEFHFVSDLRNNKC